MSDQNLENRLAEVEREVARISKRLRQVQGYSSSDPETALMHSRKVAEAICKAIFKYEIGAISGRMQLDDVIKKLKEKRKIPPKILVPLGTIQAYGNHGSHDQDDEDELTEEDIQPCLMALATVTNWYFNAYHADVLDGKIDLPEFGASESTSEIKHDDPEARYSESLRFAYAHYPISARGREMLNQKLQELGLSRDEGMALEAPFIRAIKDDEEKLKREQQAKAKQESAAKEKREAELASAKRQYQSLLQIVYLDHHVSEQERAILDEKRTSLGLSEVQAQQLEQPFASQAQLHAKAQADIAAQKRKPQHGDTDVDPTTGHPLIYLRPGSFLMGSPESELERRDNEQQHRVEITEGFWMGKYAVTVAEFRQFVQATGYQTEGEKSVGIFMHNGEKWVHDAKASWRSPGFEQNDQCPVVGVSWNDAGAFVAWLSQQSGAQYRLPTEAEWEYAARAGTGTPFSTGEIISTAEANYNGNYPYANGSKGVYRERTLPVGSLAKNPWGLYDMHGNVWEWTDSHYKDPYDGNELKCVNHSDNEGSRSVRGGSWFVIARYLRAAYRLSSAPSSRNYYMGFRLVRIGSLGQDV